MRARNCTMGSTRRERVDPVRGDTPYTCRQEKVQKDGMTEPWYLSSMNFLTSGEVRSLASFFTRGSFSLPFFTARKLPYGLFFADSRTRASLAGLMPAEMA